MYAIGLFLVKALIICMAVAIVALCCMFVYLAEKYQAEERKNA